MLRPEYLEGLPNEILELFAEAEREILADMARRISTYDFWIPAADYQNEKLREAGVLQNDIIKALSHTTRKSEEELRIMMKEAGSMALHSDESIYKAAGLSVPSIKDSQPLTSILNAGYRATATEMKNLCRTTAQTATKQFEDALDRAWLKVSSGAFDSESAIRSAVKELSEKGVQSIRYPSGHTDSIETAVRRAIVTGVNQTAAKLQDELADELGCDLVEVTAHSGARPEHAEWQGQIYSRSGKHPNYPDFVASTGYGSGEGLCGWNCRHSFAPYFEGSPPAYSQEELDKLDEPAYEVDGKKLTEYEAKSKQRYNERQIRCWKREESAMNAAGLDASEASAKVREWQARQRDFVAQTGFKWQYGREQDFSNYQNQKTAEKINSRVMLARASETFTIIPPYKGDAIKAQSIYRHLQRSEVGKTTFEYIIANKIPVEINYTDEAENGVRGYTLGNRVFVFAKNTQTVAATTETIIHEVTHIRLGQNSHTQHEEAICFAYELMHKKPVLTYTDLRDIIKTVKKLYPEYGWR